MLPECISFGDAYTTMIYIWIPCVEMVQKPEPVERMVRQFLNGFFQKE